MWETYRFDVRFKIGRASGPEFREAYRKAVRDRLGASGAEELSPEEARAAFDEALARTALHDWENIEGVPYSVEKAVEMIADPKYRHLRDWIALHADDLDRYRITEEGN